MHWIFYLLLLFLFLIILILCTKLTITVDIQHVEDNNHFKIKLRAWFGLIRYTIEIPLVKIDDDANLVVKQKQKVGKEKNNDSVAKGTEKVTPEESLHFMQDIREITQHIVGLHGIIRSFLKKVKVIKLEWHSQLGVGDAAHTGIITGAAWGIKGGVISLIGKYMKVKTTPYVTITPEFNQVCSRMKLECMFQFRIGQAIYAGIQFIKYWKGGRPKLKSKQFSTYTNQS
ncbi:hypothetical protein CHH83_23135 [Bacillus sp. 7586-K]|uniref:DUF2953 domain-containing protein n=1 Tax=Metabacillus niabensis TaxID=324854 RepID=UPI000BA61ADA|nr:hypothetical protein CHH83_23135 [Bacillus sp. 7586-K]